MKWSVYSALSVVFVLAIIALAAFLFFSRPSSNRVVVEGILLESESNPVQELLSYSEKGTFIVSPAFFEQDTINQYTANSMNLFIVVLAANDKNAVQLIRVFDKNKSLSYCMTNFGNVLSQEKLSAIECNSFLSNPSDSVKVFIEFPDSSVSAPTVLVENNSLTVKTGSFNDLAKASFVPLKVMFANAEEILEKTNVLVKEIIG